MTRHQISTIVNTHLLGALLLASLFTLAACTDDDSNIGDSLQDPGTLYNAKFDTIKGNDIHVATIYDDSLLTSGYTTGMIGRYTDAVYGTVKSTIFAQVAPVNTTGIDFSDRNTGTYTIDSAVLYLQLFEVYPDSNSHSLHLTVKQLDDPISNDSSYIASCQIGATTTFYDETFSFNPEKNILRLKLDNNAIIPLIKQQFNSQDDFKQRFRGLRIRIEDDSDPLMLTINFQGSSTLMKVHYTHVSENSTMHDTVNFLVGCNSTTSTVTHFCHFEHAYGSSPIAPLANGTIDSLPGTASIYFEPMGGTIVYLNIRDYIERFHAAHPYAAINYAELLLPVADNADNLQPDQIVAYKQYANGYLLPISDNNAMTSPYAYGGFDGTYHANLGYYRLRISQYMQELLRDGTDHGMVLFLNRRRSSARRTIINGTNHATNPIKIAIIYSE